MAMRNMGFIATRVAGTDGVSLEIGKWAGILEHMGYDCFYVCGKSDRPADKTFLIAEADFLHPLIREIHRKAFGDNSRTRELSEQIRLVANRIKDQLYAAIDHFSLDVLIAQNSLTIPLNIPLGAALVEVVMETQIPCIAHHHDFHWERERFAVNCVEDYLDAVFPPQAADIDHVVINSRAGEEFGHRTGLPYRIIPNVMDFAHPPPEPDDYAEDFLQTLGIPDDSRLILQPTRVVARKGIEHTIELVRRLNDPRCKLVITHASEDEGDAYPNWLREYAKLMGVEPIFAQKWVGDKRGSTPDGQKVYAIWDIYRMADLITYPSTYEGFGNAFVEAVYYRKPIVCNRYTIFRTDIEPLGFEAITMEGFLSSDVVERVRNVLNDGEQLTTMVERNYDLARKFLSFERVERELHSILRRPRTFAGAAGGQTAGEQEDAID